MTIAGFGVGYRPRHFTDLTKLKPSEAPQWLEVLSENFMGVGGAPLANLLSLRERFPVCLHGVSMSIAGQDEFDKAYLRDLKELIEKVDPVHVSDHLCWTSSRGHNSHDLLPVPYTSGALNHVCDRIQKIQDLLDRPLLFENPSAYVAFDADEISESEFLAEMCRRTGCGILLDVNNLYVNHLNLGVDVVSWLNRIDSDSIGYIHMAGHSVGDGIRIDTHDQLVCSEVWDLYTYVIKKFGPIPSMIEWDGDVPEFNVIQQEIGRLKTHAARLSEPASIVVATNQGFAAKHSAPRKVDDWQKIQSDFFAIVTSETEESDQSFDLSLFNANTPAAAAVGAEVYANAYIQRLCEVFRGAFPVLTTVIGKAKFENLVHDYLKVHKPNHYSVKYAAREFKNFSGLADVANQSRLDPRLLIDLASLEWSIYDLTDAPGECGNLDRSVLSTIHPERWPQVVFSFQPLVTSLALNYRVDETLKLFREGESPSPPLAEVVNLMIYRSSDEVSWCTMSELQNALFKGIQEQLPFETCCNLFQKISGESIEDTVFRAVEIIGDWLDEGLIAQIRV